MGKEKDRFQVQGFRFQGGRLGGSTVMVGGGQEFQRGGGSGRGDFSGRTTKIGGHLAKKVKLESPVAVMVVSL
jgi:hypothetical protein